MRLGIILLTVLLSVGSAGILHGFDFSEIESKITDFTLDNGMKFIVMEDHSVPVVYFCLLADVGSVDDPKGYTGMAHYFEHMAFKGTDEIGTTDFTKEKKALEALDGAYFAMRNEALKGVQTDSTRLAQLKQAFDSLLEKADQYVVVNEFIRLAETEGAVGLNAGTGYDFTRYVFAFPSNKLEFWFALESSRFSNPVLRQFYKEKGAIQEERRTGRESSPVGRLFEEFLAAAFKAHPYGIQVIGHMSDIENMDTKAALEFFRKYYVPSNMIVAMVGDVSVDQARTLAQKYFGRLPKVPKPMPVTTVEPEQKAERRVVLYEKAQPYLFMGFHRPEVTNPDDQALEAVADYLGRGRTSQLYKRLVKEKKMATNVVAFGSYPAFEDPPLFCIVVVPAKGHTALDCEKEVLAEIERLNTEPVPASELEKIKARAKADLVNQMDNRSTFSGMSSYLAIYQNSLGDWRELFKTLDKINAVTTEDMARVAGKYFTRENRTVGYIETVEN